MVVKIPRFSFEKFPNTPQLLAFSMQSVGESMAIGRTFNEALQKGLRSLEIGVAGLESRGYTRERLPELLRTPTPERIFAIGDALREDFSVDEIYALSSIDPWFLRQIDEIVTVKRRLASVTLAPNPTTDPSCFRGKPCAVHLVAGTASSYEIFYKYTITSTGTLRLRPEDAAGIADDELRDLVRGALDG